ncbi:MAG TPA: hypothetical protein VGI06_17900, partial [Acidimicrobiales bacterium]
AAQGVAAPGLAGSIGARMGAAFVGQAGTSPGLALLAAAALACWASISGDRTIGPGPRRLLVGCLVLAALLCVATPLAMAGDVAYLHHARQPVNGALRWGLGTFGLVTFIPGLLAVAVAWWGFQDLS